ncbi:hypothetical protein HHK36_021720 [Tetracentron sinense]|uniref:Neprosin PEP catalytic domain-containing protein n=1 Tax=Tetracentron sinense TaxID=13715 RepID=A0A834YVS8_TETSI|nr:hypothetical protein HHK36_021720 [Tetracentron sinense]
MANDIDFVPCLLLSIVIAHALNHGFVEGIAVKDRELLRHKAAVKTIEIDEDVIDCVDIYKQPAFDHPLLKNHKIQMKPSSYPNGMKASNYRVKFTQLWQESGHCPEGTIPIKRTQIHNFPRATPLSNHGTKIGHNISGKAQDVGYEYAVVYESENKYYGAEATINLWNPKLGDNSETSLSEILISAGTSETVNTAAVGLMYQVYPELYGDNRTRLFTYWTSDHYGSKGCYNLDCPGFVQTNGNVTLGSIISPVSNYDGEQYSVSFLIFMDKSEGNWWLEMQGNFLGYWPSSIYTTMAESASAVYWGGVIFNSNPLGHHTATQMGSGHFPYEGYGKSSYISNLEIVDSSNTLIAPVNLVPIITKSTCYDLYIGEDKSTIYGTYFYYGGPGYSKECTSETLNTAEAGLMVQPELYGDDRTRLFLFWTSDSYVSKGCYNLDCPGFVQTNGNVAMGSIISPVSNYGADQFDITFLIFIVIQIFVCSTELVNMILVSFTTKPSSK